MGLGLAAHAAVTPGVHEGAAHTGASPRTLPGAGGGGLPCLQHPASWGVGGGPGSG